MESSNLKGRIRIPGLGKACSVHDFSAHPCPALMYQYLTSAPRLHLIFSPQSMSIRPRRLLASCCLCMRKSFFPVASPRCIHRRDMCSLLIRAARKTPLLGRLPIISEQSNCFTPWHPGEKASGGSPDKGTNRGCDTQSTSSCEDQSS